MQMHPRLRERCSYPHVWNGTLWTNVTVDAPDRVELEKLLRQIRRSTTGDTRLRAEQALVLLGVERWEL